LSPTRWIRHADVSQRDLARSLPDGAIEFSVESDIRSNFMATDRPGEIRGAS